MSREERKAFNSSRFAKWVSDASVFDFDSKMNLFLSIRRVNRCDRQRKKLNLPLNIVSVSSMTLKSKFSILFHFFILSF